MARNLVLIVLHITYTTYTSTCYGAANKFGIGTYYPPSALQQDQLAAELVGRGGWVTILIPCGNITNTTILPPSCPGFSSEEVLQKAYALGLNVVARLEPLYNGDSQSSKCFAGMPSLRSLADDPNADNKTFKGAAESYAAVAASLPPPPDGVSLYVQIGNELNLAWGCSCDKNAPPCMSVDQMARESSAFLRDSLVALKAVKHIKVGLSPIAPIGTLGKQCCQSATCPMAHNISLKAIDFIRLMLKYEPDLYHTADWYSSHAYPCDAKGCGQTTSACKGWNTPYNQSYAALTTYRNETALVKAEGQVLPVVITETGWCMDCCSEEDRATWSVQAFNNIYLPDDNVVAVTPFLLAGGQWWPKGFPWIYPNGTKCPVYNSVKILRCSLFKDGSC
eukprot:m.343456 g.343456  ORF g.343456 m.343456 type:complete len:393 (+) comp22855_c0_seq1:190-1368(+)